MHVYVVTLPILHRVVLFAAPKFSFVTLLYGSTEKTLCRTGRVYQSIIIGCTALTTVFPGKRRIIFNTHQTEKRLKF